MMAVHQWLSVAERGYCGITYPGKDDDCEAGLSGTWGLRSSEVKSWETTAKACLRLCDGCQRCRYISVSMKHRE